MGFSKDLSGQKPKIVEFQTALDWAKKDKGTKTPDYGILYIVAVIITVVLLIWIFVIVFSNHEERNSKESGVPEFVPLIPKIPVNSGSAIYRPIRETSSLEIPAEKSGITIGDKSLDVSTSDE